MDTNTPATLDQRRIWLDDLLSRPHLWPGQIETAKLLAEELGVPIQIWRRELRPGAVWQAEPVNNS